MTELERLKEANRVMREKLEEIRAKEGFCIFGSSDTSCDPEQAFRQGSAFTYAETAGIAREALETADRILAGSGGGKDGV